jgi:hypothetical protein
MATKRSSGPINRLSNREVQCAEDGELFDGGGLLLRVNEGRAKWVFRYTAPSGKRREMGEPLNFVAASTPWRRKRLCGDGSRAH